MCKRIDEDKIYCKNKENRKRNKKRGGFWIAHRRVLSRDSPTATHTRLYSSFLIRRRLNDEERTLNVRQKKKKLVVEIECNMKMKSSINVVSLVVRIIRRKMQLNGMDRVRRV